jgi:hypothetical protein
MSEHRLFASIVAAGLAHLADDIGELVAAGIDAFHCDIMDGNFVPNITFGADFVKAMRPLTDKPLDAHLMIMQPEVIIPGMIEAGANSHLRPSGGPGHYPAPAGDGSQRWARPAPPSIRPPRRRTEVGAGRSRLRAVRGR